MSSVPADAGRSRPRESRRTRSDSRSRSASEKRQRNRSPSRRSSSSSSRSHRSNNDTKRILQELKQESKLETKARFAAEKASEKRIGDLQAAYERKMDKIVSLVEAKQNEQNKWNKKQQDHNKSQDTKIDKLSDGVASLTSKFDEVLKTFSNFKDEAQRATAVAEECTAATAKLQASAASSSSARFSGPPTARASTDPQANQSIIKIGAKRQTTKQLVKDAFLPHILESTGIGEDEVMFMGPGAGKNFEVTFKGNPDSAASYVNKILLALREGSGPNVTWKRFEVQDPGPEGNIPLYINRDKSPATVSREICTRKLLEALRATHSGGELGSVTMDRAFGAISLDNPPLARVNVEDRSNPTLLWVNATVARHKIDKKSVTEKFLASASRSGAMSTAAWSL